jgi:hypothetical protein
MLSTSTTPIYHKDTTILVMNNTSTSTINKNKSHFIYVSHCIICFFVGILLERNWIQITTSFSSISVVEPNNSNVQPIVINQQQQQQQPQSIQQQNSIHIVDIPQTTRHWPSITTFPQHKNPAVIKDTELGERCVLQQEGSGGGRNLDLEELNHFLSLPHQFNIKQDLLNFTGLDENELNIRLQRVRQFHFEGEHAWWNPQTRTTLSWFYRTSVSYLFANAIHPAVVPGIGLSKQHEPVLSYSDGVGNNILWLASQDIESYYFGIGINEMSFAKFRVVSRGWGNLIHFIEPFVWDISYSSHKNQQQPVLRFDPIFSIPNKQFGAILAFDVLEHIPDYHYTLGHLTKTLRIGGLFCEESPFGEGKDAQETSVHVPASKDLKQAMNDCGLEKQSNGDNKCWVKITDVDCLPLV